MTAGTITKTNSDDPPATANVGAPQNDASNTADASSTAAASGTATASITDPASGSATNTVQDAKIATGTDVPPLKPSAGISGGAVAGAAVGCLIVGLILGALGAFFLLRSRRKQRRRHRNPGEFHTKEKEPISPSSGSASTDIKLEHFLLDATPDKEIITDLRALGELVRIHVDNNYHLQPVQTHPSAIASGISQLGLPSASANEVAAICLNPQTRALGLRHLISHVAFLSIDFNAPSPLSMLPAPMAAFLHSMPPKNPRNGNSAETSLALSRWRALSAFLLHPAREDRTFLTPSEAAITPQAQGLVSALHMVLTHFVSPDPAHSAAQADHLKAVIMEFTSFGYMLLSQPTDWQFVYEANAVNTSEVVVCAGLERLGRRDGGSHNPPSLVRAPEVIGI